MTRPSALVMYLVGQVEHNKLSFGKTSLPEAWGRSVIPKCRSWLKPQFVQVFVGGLVLHWVLFKIQEYRIWTVVLYHGGRNFHGCKVFNPALWFFFKVA